MTNSQGVFVSCKNLYNETKYVKFALWFHPQEKALSEKDFLNFKILSQSTNYIGFVDKNDKTLSSSLFSLWDFSVRKDENIQKVYLQGRYGAIPFFESGVWEVDAIKFGKQFFYFESYFPLGK